MREERTVIVEGRPYTVVLSDEREALLAAEAAGRASVAVESSRGEFLPAPFALERIEDGDPEFLERVVRRKLGLPWVIRETERLILREFTEEDAEQVPEDECMGPGDGIFLDREKLRAYIRRQYGFFQYGIWAAVRREDGVLVGKIGFAPWEGEEEGLELGYHIFRPWRKRGYGREGCLAALEWAWQELDLPVLARIPLGNRASEQLARSLGFRAEREDGEFRYFRLRNDWFEKNREKCKKREE